MNSTEHAQLVDPGPAPLQQLALLEQLLAQLPLEQREILLLREVEGLAYTELTTALTINLGTVKSRLTRAREAMLIGYHQANARHSHD